MVRQGYSKIRRIVALAVLGGAPFLAPVASAEEPPLTPETKSKIYLLTGQEPPEPFVPLAPRTLEDSRRLEAIKQFCTGHLLENEFRLTDAFAAYRKALQNDPKSLAIHKALIKLANALNQKEEASKYLRDAINLAPDDFQLLSSLGQELEEQGQIESAVDLFNRAADSPQVNAHSPLAVMLKLKVGSLYEQLGDADKASPFYRAVMDAMNDPDEYGLANVQTRPEFVFLRNKAEVYERFGNIFRTANRFDDALDAFQHAQKSSPRNSRFLLNIAQVYVDQEKLPDALENLERYLKDQPHGSPAYELLATVLTKLDRSDEVLPRVQAAAAKDRRNMGLQYFLGTLYENAGDIDKAKEIYATVLKNQADDRVYKSLAGIYLKEDRFQDLILLLGQGLERQFGGRADLSDALNTQFEVLARSPEAAQKLVDTARDMVKEDPKRLNVGACYFLAKVAQSAKLVDASVEFYRMCLAQKPNVAPLYRELSQLLLTSDRTKEAIEVIRQSLTDGGRADDPDAHSDLAHALEMDGQTDEALKSAARAVELAPDRVTGHSTQAWVYMHSGQYAKAAERYEQIVKDFADDAEIVRGARYLLSNVYVQLGESPKAEKVLEEILQSSPDDESANNDLGYLWADQGKNLEQAEKMIRKALDLYTAKQEPGQPKQNAAYLDSLGWVLHRLGRDAEARKFLEEAVELEEGAHDGTIVDHLGDVYLRLKEPGKARELWQKAAEILDSAKGPRRDDKRLQEIRDKLKNRTEPKRDRGDTP